MSIWRKIGIALVVIAFLAAKVFALVSGKHGIGIAALGAVLLIISESENAGAATGPAYAGGLQP